MTPTQQPVLTVSQLTNAIKLSLESNFPAVSLQGEITNFKVQTSGHLYFSLKDAHAQIAAVMFAREASLLKTLPKAGDQVIVKAEINVYPPKGNYQLIVRELSFAGLGELLQKLEQLKIKLHQQGWFKQARKRPLPRYPKRIGVVTSPTGAVIQDILNVLNRRFSGFSLLLNPVKVQGEGAAKEIAQAIEQFNRYNLVDVMIVGRGGGSLEDLWAFNEEIVAEAIYHSKIPIISAVGHETDHCIADYVADVRAPTPSAAAEIVIAEKSQQLDRLAQIKKRMQQTLGHLINHHRFRLQSLQKQPFLAQPLAFIELRMQQLDERRQDLEQAILHYLQWKKHQLAARTQQTQALKPINQIRYFKQRLYHWDKALQQAMASRLKHARQLLVQNSQLMHQIWMARQMHRCQLFDGERLLARLTLLVRDYHQLYRQRLFHLMQMFTALDPKNLLKKGYSILFAEKEPHIINSIHKLIPGQKAKLLLSDGKALITINQVLSSDEEYSD